MATSYTLVMLTNEEYYAWVASHKGKGVHFHTFFTANLPLIWRTCNGGGVLSGGSVFFNEEMIPKKWDVALNRIKAVDGNSQHLQDVKTLSEKRPQMEELVKQHITSPEDVIGICTRIAHLASSKKLTGQKVIESAALVKDLIIPLFEATHPSDWLLTLIYSISILEGAPEISASVHKLLK